jgi:hypothetical protein
MGDYCGSFKIKSKCLDSRSDKFQQWDCSDNLNSQKFIYDSYTKTIRPYKVDSLSDLCVGAVNNSQSDGALLELQKYKNTSSQKFTYDQSNKRFNLEGNTSKCIDLINDSSNNGAGFQLLNCKEHQAQRFSMDKCSSAEPILEKIIDNLKLSKIKTATLDYIGVSSQTLPLTYMGGGVVYGAFYLSNSSKYKIKVETLNNKTAPFVVGISLNTSPFLSGISNNTSKEMDISVNLSGGIHLIIIKLDPYYTGTVFVDYTVKIVDTKTNREYNIENLSLNNVGGVPMKQWLYSSILNVLRNYNDDLNMKNKYIEYITQPVDSYGNINNTALQSTDTVLSNYSEYRGCDKACGIDSKVKFKEVIPSLHGGSDIEFTDDEIYYFEKCNKFCRTEAEVLSKWKEITKCPVSNLPPSINEKTFTYTDENGVEKQEDSPLYIDELRYVQNEDLPKVFNTWSVPTYKETSTDCYNSVLSDGNILRIGGRIYSSDGLSYLEYSATGKVSLFDFDGESAHVESAVIIRNTPSTANIGDYLKLENGKLTFYKITSTTIHSIVGSVSIVSNTKISLLISSFAVVVIDSNGFFINRYGMPLSEITISDEIKEYKFRPSSDSRPYEIIKNEGASLVMINGKIEFRSVDTSEAGVATTTILFSINIQSNEFLYFGSDGFYVSNGTTKSFESKATNVKLFVFYSNGIHMKNTEGWIIKYHNNNISALTNDMIFRKPTIIEEQDGIIISSSSGKGKLVYQTDSNLVFISEGVPIWHSGTNNMASTHMFLDKSGEIMIMNDKAVVYRSNFKDTNSIMSLLFVFDEWFFICNKISKLDESLYISRVYPNAADLMTKNMTKLIKEHITLNYNKYPKIALVKDAYSNSGNKSGEMNTEYIDFTEFLRSYNFLQCSPTDFLCNFNKTATVDPTNSKRLIYTVDISTSNTKWPKVELKSLITGIKSTDSIDYNSAAAYSYDGKRLNGYTPLISNKYIGINSSPIINIILPSGSVKCILLIKKNLEDYTVKYDEALNYVNSNITSSSQIDILDFKSSVRKKGALFELDPLKKAFSDPDGDYERDDDIKMDYCGEVKIKDKCVDSGENKFQIWDCNKTNPQKYVYDYITKSLRPMKTPTLAVTVSNNNITAGSTMILDTYINKPSQKFLYNKDLQKFVSNINKDLCLDLTNGSANGSYFQLQNCQETENQKFLIGECNDLELKKILNQKVKPPTVLFTIPGFLNETEKDIGFRDKVINNDKIIGPTIISVLGLNEVEGFKVHSLFSMKPDVSSGFFNKNCENYNNIIFFMLLIISAIVVVFSIKYIVGKKREVLDRNKNSI